MAAPVTPPADEEAEQDQIAKMAEVVVPIPDPQTEAVVVSIKDAFLDAVKARGKDDEIYAASVVQGSYWLVDMYFNDHQQQDCKFKF